MVQHPSRAGVQHRRLSAVAVFRLAPYPVPARAPGPRKPKWQTARASSFSLSSWTLSLLLGILPFLIVLYISRRKEHPYPSFYCLLTNPVTPILSAPCFSRPCLFPCPITLPPLVAGLPCSLSLVWYACCVVCKA